MDRFNKGFFSDLAERTIATFAQALLAVLGGAGLGIIDVDWTAALSVAGLAALLAVLKGFAGDLASPQNGASWGTTTPFQAVAAREDDDFEGRFEAGPAAAVREGTQVEVVPATDEAEETVDHDSMLTALEAEKVELYNHDEEKEV